MRAAWTRRLVSARRCRQARIAVDANCAWGDADFARLLAELPGIGVEFIEQPLPPARDAEMPGVCARLPVPVMADESCVTFEDMERVPGNFAGFNIKLVKCGGLTPALRMARRGRELGLATMVGCMLRAACSLPPGP